MAPPVGPLRPKVVVVGNGPVGQTAALLLARWKVPVVLLDQRPQRDAVGSRAICQQRDVLDIWDCIGAGQQIAEEGVTWTTARTFHGEQELFSYTFTDHGTSPFPPFVNISQARTEQILDQRLATEALVQVRWGHEVVEIEQDTTRAIVRCRTSGGDVNFHADYVLMCSGARSERLRDVLGVSFDGHSFDDRFLICDIRTDLGAWATERRFYFDPPWNPGRQVLIHPCPDSTYRIDWQVPAGFDLEAEAASGAMDARIRAIIGDRDYRIVWSSVYRFHSRCVDRMRHGRVLIAGDAAHLMSPFGARGLNSGVADAENAAWKLAAVLHGWTGEQLLESYHHERHAAARENLDVTTTTMKFLVPHGDQQTRTRMELLARAQVDPAVHPLVDSGRLAEPFWYVDSPLTTPSARHPFPGRPPRGELPPPGPGRLLPDLIVDGIRLREHARRRALLLLATPGIDTSSALAAARAASTAPVVQRVLPPEFAEGELWIVRPDAYVAAVLAPPTPAQVTAGIRRLLALQPGASYNGHATHMEQ